MHPFASISVIIKKYFKELKGSICKIFRHGKTKKEYKKVQFQTTKELRNLTSYVLDPLGFKARYGKLLPLLTTQVDEYFGAVL